MGGLPNVSATSGRLAGGEASFRADDNSLCGSLLIFFPERVKKAKKNRRRQIV